MFLAELNNLELWGADVGSAYLQALTREKLYIVGGPEFEELQGHVLVMYKALYGTRSGGACWHDKFFDILHHMGFKPSRADSDIWMKSSKDRSHYEYIAVYVDDLAICMKDPKNSSVTHSRKSTNLNWKELDQSIITLDVDTPEMKMELLLQIQGNMLKKYLNHMKNFWRKTKEDQDTSSGRRSPRE